MSDSLSAFCAAVSIWASLSDSGCKISGANSASGIINSAVTSGDKSGCKISGADSFSVCEIPGPAGSFSSSGISCTDSASRNTVSMSGIISGTTTIISSG